MSRIFGMKKTIGIFLFCTICSAYSLTANFFVNDIMDIMQQDQWIIYRLMACFNSAINGKEVIFSILVISLLCLYYKGWSYCSFYGKKFVILSGILSVFTILYYPYTFGNSLSLLYSTKFQIIQTILFLIGFFELFHMSINVLYEYIINRAKEFRDSKEVCLWKIVLKLGLLWLPHIIVKFPEHFVQIQGGNYSKV